MGKGDTVQVSNKKTSKKIGHGKRKKNKERFSIYNRRVLKQVHPDKGISKQAMKILDTLAEDIFYRIAQEASSLQKITNKHTMSAREIETATKLVLPGELQKHAITEGAKACKKFETFAKKV